MPRPAQPIRWVPISILPAVALSACAPPINLQLGALPCSDLVKASGLLTPTPGTAPPVDDSVGSWVAFADRQTGQLDKANADKQGAAALLDACGKWQDKAMAMAKPKRWWRI